MGKRLFNFINIIKKHFPNVTKNCSQILVLLMIRKPATDVRFQLTLIFDILIATFNFFN